MVSSSATLLAASAGWRPAVYPRRRVQPRSTIARCAGCPFGQCVQKSRSRRCLDQQLHSQRSGITGKVGHPGRHTAQAQYYLYHRRGIGRGPHGCRRSAGRLRESVSCVSYHQRQMPHRCRDEYHQFTTQRWHASEYPGRLIYLVQVAPRPLRFCLRCKEAIAVGQMIHFLMVTVGGMASA